jgi:(1->4)-alpha-D-glucan 1-alpha-D-glucosylmutase
VPPVPTATYRLQLHPGFPFAAAAETVPHLAALGVSHLHLSPLLEAVPGSTHGYDVTDHRRVRAALGGEEGLRALAERARAHGLGLVADLVPNHMAVPVPASPGDPLWDVLLHGPGSRHARWFDIDWNAGDGQLLLPVLAGPLGDEWHALSVEEGVLRYGEHRFPLRPGTERLELHELLDAQFYRLAWWRLARTELNYRRFFTINELIGLRVEDPEVFEATHTTMLRLIADGVLSGLRVDHPDGLADPGGYFRRLAERSGTVWTVAEKILGHGEQLPAGWPVAGTTGYDALRHIDGVLTDPEGCAELTKTYRAFTGAPPDLGGAWGPTARRAVYRVLSHELAAEVSRLTRAAERVCRTAPEHRLRDHAPWALRTAVVELLAGLPVYRPYVPADGPPAPADEAMLATAAESAKAAFTVPREALAVQTVRELALGRLATGPDADDFRVRFAQVSSALRAKAVEDTAFYRYTPLLSACEVGGEPGSPTLSPAAFHAYCARVQRDWPLTGTVLSTHDTKRSADVRAVLRALAEHPDGWARVLPRLTEETARTGSRAPDPHLAWTVWQSALGLGADGAEEDGPERLLATVLKSAREGALHTSWTEADPAYESALEQFVRTGPCGAPGRTLAEFARELEPEVRAGMLGAALLQLTMPGVPDVYQGTETRYTALVDPDNRRPVRLPAAELRALDGGAAPDGPGAEKLRLTAVALRLRRARPEWFGPKGAYRELPAEGRQAEHCLAFARADRVVTAVTRLSQRLTEAGGWDDTRLPLPAGSWRDVLTGRDVPRAMPLTELYADAPVALLVRTDDDA